MANRHRQTNQHLNTRQHSVAAHQVHSVAGTDWAADTADFAVRLDTVAADFAGSRYFPYRR